MLTMGEDEDAPVTPVSDLYMHVPITNIISPYILGHIVGESNLVDHPFF